MARAIGTGGRYATLPTRLEFNGDDFYALGKNLRGAAEALVRETRPVLTEMGEKIAQDARDIATSHGSKKIPGSIHGQMKGSTMYEILAGGPAVPEAYLWEFGNKGSKQNDPTFQHPVFGTSTMVDQPRYPFMKPALKKNRYMLTKLLYQAWDRALTPYRQKQNSRGPGLGEGTTIVMMSSAKGPEL